MRPSEKKRRGLTRKALKDENCINVSKKIAMPYELLTGSFEEKTLFFNMMGFEVLARKIAFEK
jgi:hypothetical protein